VQWKTKFGDLIWSTPAVSGELLIVGCYDGYLYFVERATGEVVRKVDCGGVIRANPTLVHDLVFIPVGKKTFRAERGAGKKLTFHEQEVIGIQRTRMLVIDADTGQLVSSLKTQNRFFAEQVIPDGDQVFFFDYSNLFCYDTKQRKLLWTATVPSNVIPFPILTGNTIVLPFSYRGMECMTVTPYDRQAEVPVVYLKRQNGKILRQQKAGGVSINSTLILPLGNMIVTPDSRAQAFSLE